MKISDSIHTHGFTHNYFNTSILRDNPARK